MDRCLWELSAIHEIRENWFFKLCGRAHSILLIIIKEIRWACYRTFLKLNLRIILMKIVSRYCSCILIHKLIMNITMWPFTISTHVLTRLQFCYVSISILHVRCTSTITAKKEILTSSLVQIGIKWNFIAISWFESISILFQQTLTSKFNIWLDTNLRLSTSKVLNNIFCLFWLIFFRCYIFTVLTSLKVCYALESFFFFKHLDVKRYLLCNVVISLLVIFQYCHTVSFEIHKGINVSSGSFNSLVKWKNVHVFNVDIVMVHYFVQLFFILLLNFKIIIHLFIFKIFLVDHFRVFVDVTF